ncbi:MAG: hypothetical protein EZS28_030536, partial [Streblomastix strix]
FTIIKTFAYPFFLLLLLVSPAIPDNQSRSWQNLSVDYEEILRQSEFVFITIQNNNTSRQ